MPYAVSFRYILGWNRYVFIMALPSRDLLSVRNVLSWLAASAGDISFLEELVPVQFRLLTVPGAHFRTGFAGREMKPFRVRIEHVCRALGRRKILLFSFGMTCPAALSGRVIDRDTGLYVIGEHTEGLFPQRRARSH